MDKILSKSILFTGFLIVYLLIVIFSIETNKIFAIEYDTFTSENLGIEFQFSSDWKKEALGGSILFNHPDRDRDMVLSISKSEEYVSDLQAVTEEVFKVLTGYEEGYITKIIEKPIMISTANLEMGTFLFTLESKDAFQYWTFLADKQKYLITYANPVAEFNSPENIESIDHLINSIKFL